MGSVNETISTISTSSEINVGPSGLAACVASSLGTSFTAQMQNKIGTSWQNVGSSFTAINTPQYVTGLTPGSAVRINVTAITGAANFHLQT